MFICTYFGAKHLKKEGVVRKKAVSIKEQCHKCEGTRMVLIETRKVTCSSCKGKGKNPKSTWETCADCHGNGNMDAQYYSRCRFCIDE